MHDVQLPSIQILPKVKESVEIKESSMQTEIEKKNDVGTDPIAMNSIGVGTEKDTGPIDNNIRISDEIFDRMKSALDDCQKNWDLFDRLNQFHKTDTVQIQEIRTVKMSLLSSEILPVFTIECGSSSRVAILLGEKSHDSWCSHLAKVIVSHRAKSIVYPMAVCPSCAKWSSQGTLAIGDIDGNIILANTDILISSNKVHNLSVSSIEWISTSQMLSSGSDGQIIISQLKGTNLEQIKTTRLCVNDLPRRIRSTSSSSKNLAIVALSKCNSSICVGSETGGLWFCSLPDLLLRLLPCEPRAVQGLLLCPPLLAVQVEHQSTHILTLDGEVIDILPIQANWLARTTRLIIAADNGRVVVYEIEGRRIVLDEKKTIRGMAINPQEELVILNDHEEVVFHQILHT